MATAAAGQAADEAMEAGGVHEPLVVGTGSEISPKSREVAASVYSWLSHLGTWVLMGVLTIFALRIFGPPVLYVVVLVTVVLLFLGYKGYLNLNWRRVARLGARVLDADGDGRLSVSDARLWGRRLYEVGVSFGGTALAGYGLGLWMGVRMF